MPLLSHYIGVVGCLIELENWSQPLDCFGSPTPGLSYFWSITHQLRWCHKGLLPVALTGRRVWCIVSVQSSATLHLNSREYFALTATGGSAGGASTGSSSVDA